MPILGRSCFTGGTLSRDQGPRTAAALPQLMYGNLHKMRELTGLFW
jgi:hypothetical protein